MRHETGTRCRRDVTAASRGWRAALRWSWILPSALLWLACADPWVEGQAAWEAGRYEEALGHFEAVPTTHEFYVEAHDLMPEVRFRAGKEAYEKGLWRQAIDRLRRLPEHESRYGEAQDLIGCSLYRMAEAAYDSGDYGEAQRLGVMVRTQCSHFHEARALVGRARKKTEG